MVPLPCAVGYDPTSVTLKRLSFKTNQLEPRVFERGSGEEWMIVTLYVDDEKAFCRRRELLEQLGRDIASVYSVTVNFDHEVAVIRHVVRPY